jgi:hypothetical protein
LNDLGQSGFEGELRADTIDEVQNVLRQAEEASRQGLWAASYLSCECAPAFDEGPSTNTALAGAPRFP